ncbi:MAG: methyltransferase domain-containing protein [bacterium]|nr:methyltransferase domain-containing protein [bacterium]
MSFTDPKSNIEHLMIGEEMKVIDIGAGSGAYVFAAAEIARNGKVYAVDVQKDLLLKIKAEGAKRHLYNIETVWADAEEPGGTKLSDGAMDRAIVSNLLFQVEHREGLVKEVARIIRKKGRILVVDWTDSWGGLGPQAKDVVTAKTARQLFEKVGFKMLKEFNAGDHHYGIVFEKI